MGGSGNDTYTLSVGSYGVILDSSGHDTVKAPFGIDSAAAVTVDGGRHLLLVDTETGGLIFVLDRYKHPIETFDLQGHVSSQQGLEAAIRANDMHLGDLSIAEISPFLGADASWLANMFESEIDYILAREPELFGSSQGGSPSPYPHPEPHPDVQPKPAPGPSTPSGDHSFFSSAWYLNNNFDVAAAGVDPFLHYMQFGWHEGRDPNPYFDSDWYLSQNPDVADANMNPAQHYWDFGWHEGRDPSAAFSTDFYLAAHPDVALAGMNPLEHYLAWGITEGREIAPVA